MSHEIFGNMAMYNRKPAWHGLGTVFETPYTAVNAIKEIGADFNYTLEPIVAAIRGLDGKRVSFPIKDKVAIVRGPAGDDPKPEVMGIASPNYEVIQNLQFAEALDNLTPQWPLETVGVLKGGKTVFFTLKVGSKQLGSSTIDKYFLVTDSKTGKESARFMMTPIRVECQNMLTTALSTSAVQGTLVHRQGVADEFRFRTSLMSKLIKAEQTVDEQFERLVQSVLTVQQRDVVFKAYWPMPKTRGRMEFVNMIAEDDESELRHLRGMGQTAADEFERLIERSNTVHTELIKLHEKFCDEYPDHANTAWSAWNVAVEHADFSNMTDSTGYAALFGDRARRKRNAFESALYQA